MAASRAQRMVRNGLERPEARQVLAVGFGGVG
jgi:hypothetical protein